MATPFGVLGGVACAKTNDLKTLPGATAMSMEFSAAANQTLVRFAQAFDGYAYAKLVWHAAENAEQEVLLERLNQAQSSGRFYLEASCERRSEFRWKRAV